MDSPYFSEEHDMLREQLRRFVAERIVPEADAWEEAGEVPREVLHERGALGFLGVRYPERYGGAEEEIAARGGACAGAR